MRDTAYVPKPASPPRGQVVLPPPVLAPSPEAVYVVRRLVGQRVRWRGRITATVEVPPMLRLGAVREESGAPVWEHLWLHHTRYLRALGLAEGDEIAFVARVDKLLDGSYILNRPLKAERVGE